MQAAKLIRLATVFMMVLAIFMAVLISLAIWFRWHPYRLVRVIKRIPAAISESIASLGPYSPPERVTTRGDGVPSSELLGSWASFRGDNHSAIAVDNTPLLTQLSNAAMPPVRWGLPLGEGYAGASVRHGCAYLLDYDEATRGDALRCLSLDDGQEIWRYAYPVKIKKNHGMSRTIPAATESSVVAISPKLYVSCVEVATGKERWFLDLKHDFAAVEPEWYAAQCPLIVTDARLADGRETLVLAVGGRDVLMMAVDVETGREIWRTPNTPQWSQTHVSVVPMEIGEKLTFVYCGKGGVVGVDAATGAILWTSTDWQIEIATCPSPVVCPDDRIFFCGGYKSGSVMMRVVQNAGSYRAETLWRLPDATFGAEQQTPILFDGHLFGVRQRDKSFVCLTLDGKVAWSSGSARFGGGPFVLAGGNFWLLDDDGLLTLCEANTSRYVPLGSVQALEDHGCWAPMAVASGHLFLRDQKFMKCVDIRQPSNTPSARQ